ncbi:glycosyltransferase [Vibrio alginolyticus]|uniref:glycosyltransferase n=1 Tax=Vibrio alginolyticus TaxID=663 RepID=UPI001BD57C1D|nr:glycosyltransferase [Vibrio alginolyticus]MBS9903569.1 glycosyltransferase [Vibrio alginolyticus]
MLTVCCVIPSFYPAFSYGGPIYSTYHSFTELAKFDDIFIRVSTTNTNMNAKLDVVMNKWVSLNDFQVKYYNETIVDKISLSLIFNVWKDITKADVVHIQSIFNTPTPISLIYAKLFRKKIILSPRGSLGEWCLDNGNKFKSYWLKYAIKPFLKDVVWHSTAQQEKNEILQVFPTAKVEIIPNGIEYEKFQVNDVFSKKEYIKRFLNLDADVEKIVVSMGRIQQKKGFDILLNAFVDVINQYPSAKLLIAGEDEGELASLLSLVEKLKLNESVFFIGSISGQDKIDFLANADLFVLPSHNENFGNVYVESLAAGTPIVASTNTPWSEVEVGECGKWVPNSIKETSNAMLEMLGGDREILRENAKKLAKKYDWQNIALQFKKLYEKMVKL